MFNAAFVNMFVCADMMAVNNDRWKEWTKPVKAGAHFHFRDCLARTLIERGVKMMQEENSGHLRQQPVIPRGDHSLVTLPKSPRCTSCRERWGNQRCNACRVTLCRFCVGAWDHVNKVKRLDPNTLKMAEDERDAALTENQRLRKKIKELQDMIEEMQREKAMAETLQALQHNHA